MEPQLDLIRWIRSEDGFLHPGIDIALDSDRGYHVRVSAGHTIHPGTRIASCPISTTISILNAMNIAPFGSHGTNFPAPFMSKQPCTVVQYFFLMEQYLLGQKSWWAPYISAIPSPAAIDSMLFTDGSDDMRWLAGTNLKGAIAKQTDKWKELYAAASTQLRNLHWPNAENHTWRLFLWAAVIFGSRGFTSKVLSDTLPADQARPAGHKHLRHEELSELFSEGFGVLCPLLDILNYQPGARVEWQPRSSYVGLQVLEQYEPGEEICNNYGPRDNENLMLSYCFAVPSNPFDHFSVGLRVPPGSPLAHTRTWYPEKKKPEDFQCYIFNADHPRAKSASCLEASLFSFDLLDSVSVLCANDRELQAMFESRRTYIKTTLAPKTTKTTTNSNHRNLLHTLAQLYRECEQRLGILQKSEPSSTPSTPQQRYAQIHRASQTEILATAMLLCRHTLLRAQQKTTPSIKEAVAYSASSQSPPSPPSPSSSSSSSSSSSPQPNQTQIQTRALTNLRTLLQRPLPINISFLTQSNELFTFASLLPLLLPTEAQQEELLAILRPGQISSKPGNNNTPPSPLSSSSISQRARLAALLAAILLRRRSSTPPLPLSTLPARFEKWFDKLTEWYDFESWSTLGSSPDADAEDDTEDVQTLLSNILGRAQQVQAQSGATANANINANTNAHHNDVPPAETSNPNPKPTTPTPTPTPPTSSPPAISISLQDLIWVWNVVGEESVLIPRSCCEHILDRDVSTATTTTTTTTDGKAEGEGDDAGGAGAGGLLMLYIPHPH